LTLQLVAIPTVHHYFVPTNSVSHHTARKIFIYLLTYTDYLPISHHLIQNFVNKLLHKPWRNGRPASEILVLLRSNFRNLPSNRTIVQYHARYPTISPRIFHQINRPLQNYLLLFVWYVFNVTLAQTGYFVTGCPKTETGSGG